LSSKKTDKKIKKKLK